MAKFVPNQPIVTREPSIVVDAGLPPGEYRFRLVVFDNDGNPSEPDEQVVRVVERRIRPPIFPPIIRPEPPIFQPPVVPPQPPVVLPDPNRLRILRDGTRGLAEDAPQTEEKPAAEDEVAAKQAPRRKRRRKT